jgi:tetratricopeptide (TPR) repeat protein
MATASYSDLDLMVSRDRNNDTWVQAMVGPRQGDPVQLVLRDLDLVARLDGFKLGTASEADVKWLGQELFAALLPGGLRALWDWAVQALGRERPLRLRLNIRDPELSSLPWELICAAGPASYPFVLSPLRPVVRCSDLLAEPTRQEFPHPLRILVAVAEPADRPPFDAAGIVRRVQDALGGLGPKIELRVVEHVTVPQLDEEMGGGWDVVHFIGHGGRQDGTDCLLLEDEAGRTSYLDGESLSQILLRDPALRLFLSCACGGGHGGGCDPHRLLGVAEAALRAEVPAAVAMQRVITDRQMADFSYEFYHALINGERLEAAMTSARHRLSASALHDTSWAAPVLYSNIKDGLLYTDAPASEPDERGGEEPPVAVVPVPHHSLVERLPWPTYTRLPLRNGELRAIGEALERGERLVVVRGPAGYGSSSLILEAARRYLTRVERTGRIAGVAWAYRRSSPLSAPFPNRQHMGWTADELFRQIAFGLRVRGLLQASPTERWNLLRGTLAQQRYLLVIDDIDDLRGLTPADLLDRFPAPTTVLATSHVPIGYCDEQGCDIQLDALPLGDAYTFVRDTAADLGLSRGSVPGPDRLQETLRSAAGDAFALRQFTGALADGARVEDFAVSEGKAGGGLIRRVVRRSMSRLAETERAALEFAAVFPEPLALDDMAELLHRDPEDTLRCLHRLEVLGLVAVEPGARRVHVSQRVRLESLYGCGQHKAQQLIRAAVAHALTLAERNAGTGGSAQQGVSADKLANEFWAAGQAYGLRDWPAVLRFRDTLHDVLYHRHMYNEAFELGEWAYDAADRIDDEEAQAWCALFPLARVRFAQGSFEEARLWSEKAYDKFERLDHRHGRALAEKYLGRVFARMGFLNEADLHWRNGLELASRDTPTAVRGHLVSGQASAAEAQGDYEKAGRLYEEALEFYRKAGERWGTANMEHRLGRLAMAGPDRKAADTWLRASLTEYQGMGLPEQQAQVLCTLAELQEADGDLVEAHTRLLEAFEQLQPLEVTDGLADIEAALARVTARQEAGVPLFDGLAGAVQLYEAWVRCPDLADGGLPPTRILHRFEPHFPICKPHHKRYVLTDPPGVQP